MSTEREPVSATFEDRVKRLMDAMEGELDGLSCAPDVAAKILAYVDTGLAPDERAIRAAPDAPGEPVAFNATHRHKKRGSVYRVIGEAEAQVSTGSYNGCGYSRRFEDGSRLTVYEAEDGRLWARFTDEFEDGRFEALSPLSHKEG